MIFIDRSNIGIPTYLTDSDGKAHEETLEAIDYYEVEHKNTPGVPKSYKFSAYSNREVKETLNNLFTFKCAYCETLYGSIMPVDVEHFRPKGKVILADGSEKRGYYWLAASWDNLLPSCIDCNRSRNQVVAGEEVRSGKANQFPLSDENKRWTRKKCSHDEGRLLLNPCVDDPAEFLEFTDDAVVRPLAGLNAEQELRARESIRVFGLNRAGLVHARRTHLFVINDYLYTCFRVVEAIDATTGEVREILFDILLTQMQGLHRLCAVDQPYTQMSRQVIKRYWKELFNEEFEIVTG